MAAERIGDILQRILPERLSVEVREFEVNDLVVDEYYGGLYHDVLFFDTASAAFQRARQLRRTPPRLPGGARRAIGVYRRKKLLQSWEIKLGEQPCPDTGNPPSAS